MADLQPGGTAFHIVHHDAGTKTAETYGRSWSRSLSRDGSGLRIQGCLLIFHNLVNSARLVELFKGGPDSNPEAMEANRKFLKLLYEHVNKEKCDLDHQEFSS